MASSHHHVITQSCDFLLSSSLSLKNIVNAAFAIAGDGHIDSLQRLRINASFQVRLRTLRSMGGMLTAGFTQFSSKSIPIVPWLSSHSGVRLSPTGLCHRRGPNSGTRSLHIQCSHLQKVTHQDLSDIETRIRRLTPIVVAEKPPTSISSVLPATGLLLITPASVLRIPSLSQGGSHSCSVQSGALHTIPHGVTVSSADFCRGGGPLAVEDCACCRTCSEASGGTFPGLPARHATAPASIISVVAVSFRKVSRLRP